MIAMISSFYALLTTMMNQIAASLRNGLALVLRIYFSLFIAEVIQISLTSHKKRNFLSSPVPFMSIAYAVDVNCENKKFYLLT